MMGMGEPLYNFDNVKAALAIVADGDGLALSKRRITLSTAGVVPMIPRAGEEIGSSLAISLHAVRDEIRDVIVPINKKYPLAELLARLPHLSRRLQCAPHHVRICDAERRERQSADARELVKIIRGIPAKINLIPFNPWPGAPYECSRLGRRSKNSPKSSTAQATPRRCARHAAGTSWPPAASSRAKA